MKWNSFRVRLSLWNAAVLALLLGGFGVALCWSTQDRMRSALDQELLKRAERVSQGPPPQPPPPPRRDPPPPRVDGEPGEPPPNGPPPGQEGRQGDSSGDSDVRSQKSEMDRIESFIRPRFINRDGRVVAPPRAPGPWDSQVLATAAAGNEILSTVTQDGERVRVATTPWRRDGENVGEVQVAREMGEYDRVWDDEWRTLWIVLPLSLIAAIGAGLFLTGRALRPVHQVTQAAAQLGAGDLSSRLEVSGNDELAELGETFNSMIARLDEAFERQRRFTADASHELRTPLARIKVCTSEALSGPQSSEEYREALALADGAADMMGRLIEKLLILARVDAGALRLRATPVEIGNLLRRVSSAAGGHGAAVAVDLPEESLAVEGDEEQLSRVWANLVENAIRHTTEEGQVTLLARAIHDKVLVQVIDTGEGIPPEHLPHLGERFYRVDAARTRNRGGAGLGLAICRGIIAAHCGSISFASEVGRGTTVTVTLPRADCEDASITRRHSPR